MNDILLLYGYSLILFILTVATSNNKAPFVTGVISAALFVVATVLLIRKLTKEDK